MQELLNEVHMGKNHASATISLELKFIESVPFTHVFCEELKIRVPFVANDFSAGETAHRNDHLKSLLLLCLQSLMKVREIQVETSRPLCT